MTQPRARKKTSAQLDREIADALRRPKAKRTRRSKEPLRGHATITQGKDDPKQADILLVANDAALSTQFGRAAKLVSQGQDRKIATAFTTVTDESAAAGDYASRGWEDEDGDAIDIDENDIEEAFEADSHAPVTDAFVQKAIAWLRDHGAIEASSSTFHPGVWYETEFAIDYGSGEEKQKEFFLRNFTVEEQKRVFEEFSNKRRRR